MSTDYSAASYIHLVQHLIEECLLFNMSKQQCADALSKLANINPVQHLIEECLLFNMSKQQCADALSKLANINPVVTSTVWKELEKENKDFFVAYAREGKEREDRMRMFVKEKSQRS